jgi:hypothetical protein
MFCDFSVSIPLNSSWFNYLVGIEDLDFYIGDEALVNQKTYSVNYPIRHGQIENWDLMERYWEQCIFKYMRCEPEDHAFLLVWILSFLRHFILLWIFFICLKMQELEILSYSSVFIFHLS